MILNSNSNLQSILNLKSMSFTQAPLTSSPSGEDRGELIKKGLGKRHRILNLRFISITLRFDIPVKDIDENDLILDPFDNGKDIVIMFNTFSYVRDPSYNVN